MIVLELDSVSQIRSKAGHWREGHSRGEKREKRSDYSDYFDKSDEGTACCAHTVGKSKSKIPLREMKFFTSGRVMLWTEAGRRWHDKATYRSPIGSEGEGSPLRNENADIGYIEKFWELWGK